MTPIFILSCERAGSTLLRYVVDTHPDLCSPAELYLGRTLDALKVTLERSTALLQPKEVQKAFVISELRRVCGGILDDYARQKGKRHWCEKTPLNLRSLGLIDEVFPDARHICLHRNCMDVVHSALEAGRYGFVEGLEPYIVRNPTNTVAAMAGSWVEKTEQLLEFERSRPERCFRMKYEAVVFDPAATLAPMFDFLGVAWDPALLLQVFKTTHDQGEGNAGDRKIRLTRRIERRVGSGSTISRDLLPSGLLERVNQILRKLEYPEIGPDWDRAPSPYVPRGGTSAPWGAAR
ncbi:MAG TPA: sulfotransferase [Myxococcales bacterium]|nr:sulfotransferase [Myxococcales bacterium]